MELDFTGITFIGPRCKHGCGKSVQSPTDECGMCEPPSPVAALLRKHQFTFVNHSSIGSADHCRCGYRPRGWYEWSTHVAELLAGVLPTGEQQSE
jgi:hypothetical protein